jgi:hypothetical protein
LWALRDTFCPHHPDPSSQSAHNSRTRLDAQEDRPLTDSREALRTLIREIKAGKADHLL